MILLGNTFPLALVRRRVTIEPFPLEVLCTRLRQEPHLSFWGHENTRAQASAVLGIEIASSRSALSLDPENLPQLDGHRFTEVFILSPDYQPGFRPTIGLEVTLTEILGWQVLRLSFQLNL